MLARSTFHHSINYRSVVVFGVATEVTDLAEKPAALAAVVEHIVPGRTAEARPATDKEVKGTMVLALSLTRRRPRCAPAPPVDDDDDLALPVWAGRPALRDGRWPSYQRHARAWGMERPPTVTGYRRG